MGLAVAGGRGSTLLKRPLLGWLLVGAEASSGILTVVRPPRVALVDRIFVCPRPAARAVLPTHAV